MNDWVATLRNRLSTEDAVVRVVVAGVVGSAPREAGACMLVGERDGAAVLSGSIGGGHLEWRAMAVARCMLASHTSGATRLDRLSLGATLGQCCGGAVDLWFERFDARNAEDCAFVEAAHAASRRGAAVLETVIAAGVDGKPSRRLRTRVPERTPRIIMSRMDSEKTVLSERIDLAGTPLWLFGAGHVGAALINVLAALPLRITWVDSREEQFSAQSSTSFALPANVTILAADDPAAEVADAPAGAHFLVMTHSHDLDDEICRAIMDRGDSAWAGLIGSKSKGAKFIHRWERHGYRREEIARITCPIGIPGITGKLPAAIAVAVAAQVLQVMEARTAVSTEETAVPAVKSVAMPLVAVLPAPLPMAASLASSRTAAGA